MSVKIYGLHARHLLITGSAMWGMFIYVIIISGAFCQDLVSEYYALTKQTDMKKGDSPEVIK